MLKGQALQERSFHSSQPHIQLSSTMLKPFPLFLAIEYLPHKKHRFLQISLLGLVFSDSVGSSTTLLSSRLFHDRIPI